MSPNSLRNLVRFEMESQQKTIAFFDVDGTLLSSTIVHCYIWLRTASMSPAHKFFWYIGFLPKVIYYLLLDRISRTKFNIVFYRNYRGMEASEVKASATDMFEHYLSRKVFPEAISQIEEHRENGDQVVLLTGALDFIVDPIADFFGVDSILAPSLAEQENTFTGELTTEPLIGEQKAIALRKFAEEVNIPLDICYAYSDSQSDLPMLNCVGNPVVVNPSKALRQKAMETGWEMHEWMEQS